MKKVAIFGSSGFASELADICEALGVEEIVYISEADSAVGTSKNGISLVNETHIPDLVSRGFNFAIGIASPNVKEKIYLKYSHLNFVSLVHPSTSFGRGQFELFSRSKGLVVAAGVRFMSGIEVGDFVAISLNATIGHDCSIGSYVSIMPGANVSGNVSIDDKVYIGSGAVVLPGNDRNKLYLCKSLTIGAGAVVTKSFSNAVTVVGVPARVVK